VFLLLFPCSILEKTKRRFVFYEMKQKKNSQNTREEPLLVNQECILSDLFLRSHLLSLLLYSRDRWYVEVKEMHKENFTRRVLVVELFRIKSSTGWRAIKPNHPVLAQLESLLVRQLTPETSCLGERYTLQQQMMGMFSR
jgi:hypothetical protein